MNIKEYNTETQFRFGKYRGRTVKEVINLEPAYIVWCIVHLDHFCISPAVSEYLKEKNPNFEFSDSVEKINLNKRGKLNAQYDYYEEDKPSHGKYSGSYAQDMEGLSDSFIDDVLDGFPDAYWNID